MAIIEQKETERAINIRLNFGVKLSPRQRAYYLLYMATPKQAVDFIKKEKSCKNK